MGHPVHFKLTQCDVTLLHRSLQGFSVYVSTLTLTIIAIDRYVVIVYPFRARMQVSTEERSRNFYYTIGERRKAKTVLSD